MHNSLPTPRLIGATVSVLLATLALTLPAAASAAPEEGSGTLTVTPDPVVLTPTTVGNQSPAQAVQLGYAGEGEAAINQVTIEGEEAGEFFSNGSNCGSLADGQHCETWIGLKPSSLGEKQALLVVTFLGERPAVSFPISGRSVAPELSFGPASYDFGLRRINRESQSTTFQVSNDGEAEVQVNSFEISGPGSSAFWTGNSNCWGSWLAPGQSCSMQVWFNPTERIVYEAELRAWVNGSVFSAALSGQGGRPVVEAGENPVGFGAATVGATGPVRTITLHNSGDLPESFFIGVLAGGDAGSFRLLDEDCTSAPLAPGGSCAAHVRFSPDGPGTKTARVAFFGDGEGGVLIQVSGEGVLPVASIAPSGFDFGSQEAGTRSAPHSFAIANPGTTPVDLKAVSIGGAELDQFVISGDECSGATLAPGEKCLVRVRFAPDGTGLKQATLRVSGDAPTVVASLSGTATRPGAAGPAASASASAAVLLPGPPPAVGPRPPRLRRHPRFARGADLVAPSAGPSRRSDQRAGASRR
ncbi:MAG: choice-of-anchor D domain-containing protein [Solirubrobacterales bacterium]